MTDPEIVEALRRREERVLEILRVRLGQMLRYFAEKITKNPYEAEEVVSDAFFALWNKDGDFDTLTVIKSYLFQAVKNGAIKRRVKGIAKAEQLQAYVQHLDTEQDLAQEMLEAEILAIQAARFEAAIRALPERRRQILRLYLIHKMKPAEIAKALGLKTQSVKNLRILGIQSLHEIIAGQVTSGSAKRKGPKGRNK